MRRLAIAASFLLPAFLSTPSLAAADAIPDLGGAVRSISASMSKLGSLEVVYERTESRKAGETWNPVAVQRHRLILVANKARSEMAIEKTKTRELRVYADGKTLSFSQENKTISKMPGFHVEMPLCLNWIGRLTAIYKSAADITPSYFPAVLSSFSEKSAPWADMFDGTKKLDGWKTDSKPAGVTNVTVFDKMYKKPVVMTYRFGNGNAWPTLLSATVQGAKEPDGTTTFGNELTQGPFAVPKTTTFVSGDFKLQDTVTACQIDGSFDDEFFEIDPATATAVWDGEHLTPIK